MRRPITATGVILVVLFLCPAAWGMRIDSNSVAEITTSPDHQVWGGQGQFGVSGDVSVWLDGRDPEYATRIYGVNLSDPCHQEFEIDTNLPACSRLAMSWPAAVYDVWPESGVQALKAADITDQNNPFIFDFWPLIQYVDYIDISGRMVAYSGDDPNNEYRETVCAADISDGNNVRQYVISVLPTDHYISGLAIDGNRIVWSANCWEPNGYVQVADITDPNNPNVATAFLPEETDFEQVDASGERLAAHGWYDGRGRIYAVHNYTDVNNWNVVTMWAEGGDEYYVSGPRLDGPIAVWVATTRPPSMRGEAELLQGPEYMLMGAYLAGNGGFTVSTLRRGTNGMHAADVSGKQVVWSEQTGVTDLMKGAIVNECGDWGYKRGDLDHDCKVDLIDFALFAEGWLECTMPDESGCEFGD